MGEKAKHNVEILPIGLTIMIPDGEAIMSVALSTGWRWPNVCGGEAACGVCVLEVLQGMENGSPIGRDEAVRLAFIRKADKPGARLACQLRVSGPMRVLKRGARPSPDQSGPPGGAEGA